MKVKEITKRTDAATQVLLCLNDLNSLKALVSFISTVSMISYGIFVLKSQLLYVFFIGIRESSSTAIRHLKLGPKRVRPTSNRFFKI